MIDTFNHGADVIIDSFREEYAFLSNFYICKVAIPSELFGSFVPAQIQGMVFPSVEHAYQAAKCRDGKMEMVKKIQRAWSSGYAKRLGQKVDLREGWEEMKIPIMEDLLLCKFRLDPLWSMLWNTGDEELVEANTWRDTFWGVYCGQGRNELGKALMRVRGRLLTLRG